MSKHFALAILLVAVMTTILAVTVYLGFLLSWLGQ